jgi:UDP:flavonoid glycosyltransferase YjiC (YdhE family)
VDAIRLAELAERGGQHYGVPGFKTMFDYWRGDLNLVAEPDDFTGTQLPASYRFVGPIVAQQDFPIPSEVSEIPRARPIVYFAMGSSGTPEIIRNIVRSFRGAPYRVIAPIRSLLQKIPDFAVPDNVLVTDWLPALKVNRMADIAVIHGGIGTVMTAALAGTPIVGVPMQPEQSAKLAAIVRKGFAIRVPKSRDPSRQVQAAILSLLADETAHRKAKAYAEHLRVWNGPKRAADILLSEFGPEPTGGPAIEEPSPGGSRRGAVAFPPR